MMAQSDMNRRFLVVLCVTFTCTFLVIGFVVIRVDMAGHGRRSRAQVIGGSDLQLALDYNDLGERYIYDGDVLQNDYYTFSDHKPENPPSDDPQRTSPNDGNDYELSIGDTDYDVDETRTGGLDEQNDHYPGGDPGDEEQRSRERYREISRYCNKRLSVEELDQGERTESMTNNGIHLHTADDLRLLPPHPEGKRFPDCLIIGARKCGTGALRDFLALHPDVVAPVYEPGFFFMEDRYRRGLGYYRESLPAATPQQVLIEKSAEYLHNLQVPERVHALNSSMKLMLIVRDPFRRILSDYLFLRRYRQKPNAIEKNFTIEELLYDEQTGTIRSGWPCLKRSVYYIYFKEWLKYFPRNQILVIDGDQFMKNNPGKELIRVQNFLGVKPILTESKFYFNDTKGFYCVKETGCMEQSKGHAHPVVPVELEQRTRDYLKPYNRKFYEAVGYDFNWK